MYDESDYILYGDFVASEDGYSAKKKKKKKKKGKKKVIEICNSPNSGVFAFLAFGTLTINISLSFMFSLMVDIMITAPDVSTSVTVTNNNNNNNNNKNENMNMNTNARRRKRSKSVNATDDLKKFIRELDAPEFYLKKCLEERILSSFGFLQLLYNDYSLTNCGQEESVCKGCGHQDSQKRDWDLGKFRKHNLLMNNACHF